MTVQFQEGTVNKNVCFKTFKWKSLSLNQPARNVGDKSFLKNSLVNIGNS